MANDFRKSPLIIDTAESGDITALMAGFEAGASVKIELIRALMPTSGDDVEIRDMSGRVLWISKATAANFVDNSRVRQWWRGGFCVPVVDTGVKLYIYLAEG